MRELRSNNHSRHLILFHLIFASKYRRKIFENKDFGEALKSKFVDISSKYDFESVGNVSADQVHQYLESQGRNEC